MRDQDKSDRPSGRSEITHHAAAVAELSPDAKALLEQLAHDSPMIEPKTLVAAAELIRAGLAGCYDGMDGEIYLHRADAKLYPVPDKSPD